MTSPVAAFRDAEHYYRVMNSAFRELDPADEGTAQERRDLLEPLAEAGAAATKAAQALIAHAAGRHRIEDGVKVYLDLGSDGWEIALVTTDGYPLDSTIDSGPCAENCEHYLEKVAISQEDLDDECRALQDACTWITLPTYDELVGLPKAAR